MTEGKKEKKRITRDSPVRRVRYIQGFEENIIPEELFIRDPK